MVKRLNKLNLSTYLGLFLLLFAVISFISIFFLRSNLIVSNKLEQEIVFNTIQRDTSNIFAKVLYKYEKQKQLLKQKHQIVLDYINKQKDPLNIDLQEIYNKINDNNNRYNIYISDDNLIIRNTTFKNDIGFDISFAKDTFKKHKKDKKIGVSAPTIESSTNRFFSFSDSYLNSPNDKKILQVSYTYEGFDNVLEKLHANVDKYKYIKGLKVYLYLEDEKFTADFYFKKYKGLKPSLEELKHRILEGNRLSKLDFNNSISKIIKKENNVFREVFIIEESPISSNAKIMYSILFDQTKYENILKIYKILLYLIVLACVISLVVTFFMRKMEKKHMYDNLTKTYNRNGFQYIYDLETKRCDRYNRPFSMIMLDIDSFKKINDNYGHLVGDDVLVSMCELINKSIRENDYLIRWGGEEFLILAPETDLDNALKLAEKLRLLIDKNVFKTVGHMTISLSVVQKNDEDLTENILKRLDDLLYNSKNSGKNKTSFKK
ncbi:GGDEF domain-containing protein [Poseidonibacter lekithochrous]|uniref:GGDEF domain-containing protein n=1 Tax=Poseidonibacter TaxID=2321187 RepID=UPI001C096EE2|nr:MULTISPECIES: GGDEF domain-containing protein [Poseidonibacter]MBU3013174.1 GGDEF domain-containing protein [Poseidonibacter lekithochrous]MDO6826470.1 GGDEF domain-containing protein [Poseidonibacter sp. 1_MG-2023]